MRFPTKLFKAQPFYTEMPPFKDFQIMREAQTFRQLAALAWDDQTIYPKNQYRKGSPEGQCGVTNFGFGLWLARLGIVRAEEMRFEEGVLRSATDASLMGDDHTWLRVDVNDSYYDSRPMPMRLDVTADQFPGIDSSMMVQYDDYFFPDPKSTYCRTIYVRERSTPFLEYNTAKFNGRLERFMTNVATEAAALPL